jgi:hypothetical protein
MTIDLTFIVWLVAIIIVASIAVAIIKKLIKSAFTIAMIAIVAAIIMSVLINQDLKSLETSTFVFQKENFTVAVMKEGNLLPSVLEKERVLVFDEKDFPNMDEKTIAEEMKAKLSGTEKENQLYLLENAESQPETIAYKLKPIAEFMLKR